MRKIITLVLVASLVLVGGAKCSKDSGGGSGGGRQAQGSPDFLVHVSAKGTDNREVRRQITCVISGFGADGALVTVRDEQTGTEIPYVNTVTERSPARIRIKNHAGTVRIEVTCIAALQKSEAILCEFTDGNGRRPAPLFKSQDYQEAKRKGSGYRAACSASINSVA